MNHTLIRLAEAQVILGSVLAIITAYYAVQTHRMAKEMRDARLLTVRPKIALRMGFLRGVVPLIQVVNVGQGPALNVSLRIVFEPADGSQAKREERLWETSLLLQGEGHDFFAPDRYMGAEDFTASFASVQLAGWMTDTFDQRHQVEDSMVDLAKWWAREQEARRKIPDDPVADIADRLRSIEGRLMALMPTPFTPGLPVTIVKPRRLPKRSRFARLTALLTRRIGS